MGRKIVSGTMLTLIFITTLRLAFTIQQVEAGDTIYIRADGSVDPDTAPIQREGDVYTFSNDIYNSSIVIERDNVILDGQSYTLQGTEVMGSHGISFSQKSNITLKNIQIEAFDSGVYFSASSGITISDNHILDNRVCITAHSNVYGCEITRNNIVNNSNGFVLHNNCSSNIVSFNNITNGNNAILLYDSHNNHIYENRITLPDYTNAIWLRQSHNNVINGNSIIGSDYGVILQACHSCNVYENEIIDGGTHGTFYAIWVSQAYNNQVHRNKITYSWGIFVYESNSNLVEGNDLKDCLTYSIILRSSNQNRILRNSITNKWPSCIGIKLDDSSSYNRILRNNITNNPCGGIFLSGSSNNTVSLNNIADNGGLYGISGVWISFHSSGNIISLNNLTRNNPYNIQLHDSRNNFIHHNNLVTDTHQVEIDNSTDIWHDCYPSGGNYWSDYNGADEYHGPNQDILGGDGLGDIPYVIDAGNLDRYPSMTYLNVTPSGGLEPPYTYFTYSPSPPYNPVIDQEITFEVFSSWDIVNFHWDFGDGTITDTLWETTTHSYNIPGIYTVTLTVTNGLGETNFTSQLITVKRPAVVLVHGHQHFGEFNPDEIWSVMNTSLSEAGFDVYIAWYAPTYKGTSDPIWTYSKKLEEDVNWARYIYEVDKVDIVAHSMGGLVSRWYLEVMEGGDKHVRKLIMLETPNHGGPEWILKPLGFNPDLIYQSLFLQILNRYYYAGDPKYDSYAYPNIGWTNHYYPCYDIKSPKVHYEIIGGLYYQIFPSSLFDLDMVYVPLSNTFPMTGHDDLIQRQEVISWIKLLLNDDPQPPQPQEHDPPIQFAPSVFDTISPTGQNCHEVLVSSTVEATFVLAWSLGNLNLTLKAPNGTLIDRSVAENDPNITYYEDENVTIEYYNIINPQSGIWKVNVTAANITGQENYTIITMLNTNITLSLELQKYQYGPSEPVQIKASLVYGNESINEASVSARIRKSDNTTETMTLYDDGLHNDNQTNDGVYGNTYTNTSLWGPYDITVTGTGSVNTEQFAQETSATVWVEQYPDLSLNESDIHFSKENPLEGETITINATIHNTGETDANNASIVFYDQDARLLGEYIVNVTAGEAENASIQWNVTCGTHQINVLISPYNEFLELNYTNNIAQRTLEVTIAGDVDRDRDVDTSDLFDLSRTYGSISGDANWDERCDINGDGRVDASDLFDLSKNYGKTV